jgi:hypothetical protein
MLIEPCEIVAVAAPSDPTSYTHPSVVFKALSELVANQYARWVVLDTSPVDHAWSVEASSHTSSHVRVDIADLTKRHTEPDRLADNDQATMRCCPYANNCVAPI